MLRFREGPAPEEEACSQGLEGVESSSDILPDWVWEGRGRREGMVGGGGEIGTDVGVDSAPCV